LSLEFGEEVDEIIGCKLACNGNREERESEEGRKQRREADKNDDYESSGKVRVRNNSL